LTFTDALKNMKKAEDVSSPGTDERTAQIKTALIPKPHLQKAAIGVKEDSGKSRAQKHSETISEIEPFEEEDEDESGGSRLELSKVD